MKNIFGKGFKIGRKGDRLSFSDIEKLKTEIVLRKYIRQQIRNIINEGSAKSGKLELTKISKEDALDFLQHRRVTNIDQLFSDFEYNFVLAKRKASRGWTKRKEMPVIDAKDVRMLQLKLKKGFLDVNDPWADFDWNDEGRNPVPEGLTGKAAHEFVSAGLSTNDGDADDDKVSAEIMNIEVGKLKPIQKQIYFDKAVNMMLWKGPQGLKSFLNDFVLIASNDRFIIDGHHRFLAGILMDPKFSVKVLVIDMPIRKLLKLALAYGDAIGNQRNK